MGSFGVRVAKKVDTSELMSSMVISLTIITIIIINDIHDHTKVFCAVYETYYTLIVKAINRIEESY